MLSTVKKVGKGVGSLFASNASEEAQAGLALPPSQAALTFYLHSASLLIPSDPTGFADTFAVLRVGEARQWRSGVISRTNSPVRHRQRHTLELPPSHLVWLSLELWDSDVSSAENAQGRCVLPVAQLLRANGPVEVELGRDSPRQSVGGNVCIELRSMVVESASLDSALLVEQAGEGGSSRCEDCVRFGELCEQADAAPGAVGVGISPNEMLEVRRAAYLERGEEKREALFNTLTMSNHQHCTLRRPSNSRCLH